MPVTIAFVSQKGGVGKSTLARAVAAVAAAEGINVLLADLDPQQATAVRWEKGRSEHPDLPSLAVKGFTTAAQALAAGTGHELLVIDSPARAGRGTLTIAEQAHLVVVPCGPSLDDLHPTVLLLHDLVQAGIPSGRLVVALNRILSDDEEARARGYLTKAGYEVLHGCIAEKSAYRDALDRGLALTEAAPKALRQKADALMESLLTRVMAQVKIMARSGREKRG